MAYGRLLALTKHDIQRYFIYMNDFLRVCNCDGFAPADCERCFYDVGTVMNAGNAMSVELPAWIRIGPSVNFRTECLRFYTEFLLLCYNEGTNSRMRLSDERLEPRLTEYLAKRWLHSPHNFAQAFGYALARSGGKSRDFEVVDSCIFQEYCKKKVWEYCVKNSFLADPYDESEFARYYGNDLRRAHAQS